MSGLDTSFTRNLHDCVSLGGFPRVVPPPRCHPHLVGPISHLLSFPSIYPGARQYFSFHELVIFFFVHQS